MHEVVRCFRFSVGGCLCACSWHKPDEIPVLKKLMYFLHSCSRRALCIVKPSGLQKMRMNVTPFQESSGWGDGFFCALLRRLMSASPMAPRHCWRDGSRQRFRSEGIWVFPWLCWQAVAFGPEGCWSSTLGLCSRLAERAGSGAAPLAVLLLGWRLGKTSPWLCRWEICLLAPGMKAECQAEAKIPSHISSTVLSVFSDHYF